MPLIGAADTAPLMGILFALAALGFWVDGHRQLQKTSGALWIIVCGVLLSNFHITPFESASYGFVFDYLLPMAIPLLLFKANLVLIFRESGKVMLTFLFASMATVIAAITALQFVDLGANSPEIAGVIAGGYIGGTMNFVAIGKAVGMDTDLFSVTIGANSVVSVIALSILIALPSISLVRRLIPSRIISEKNEADAIAFNTPPPPRLRLTHISLAIGLSLAICTVSHALAVLMNMAQYSILLVTAFAVMLASIAPSRLEKLEGDFDLGMLIMYLFFAAIGLSTNVTSFLDSALNIFFYALLVVVLHITLVLLVARVLKLDLAEALVGSAAALVGPGPTAAIASANGWHRLISPGIVCGLFGYIIANFIGVTLTKLLG